MGNSCSSGQAHKDKDNASQHSEESPSYQVTLKKPSTDATAAESAAPEPEVPGALLGPTASFRDNRKAGLSKVLRGVASSSISDSMSLSSPVAAQSPRELEPALVPASVAALGEEARAALLGRLPRARARSRALVLYVCAADSQDCYLEKGALHARVAPGLRARARRHGRRLHVADLHWRSELEQQRDHRFPELCTAELARQCELASVVPVVFLNAGLGTPLLPHTLDSADFKAALDAAGSDDDKQLLNKWYSMDSGATPPCYRLARAAPARWRREMARALAVLVRTLSQEARDAYLTTVVEQEVHNTVLMSQEQARRCIWVCRAGNAAGGSPSAPSAPSDTDDETENELSDAPGHHELQRRLANMQRDLKQHLSEKHIVRASVRAAGSSAEYEEGVRVALDERLGAVLDALVADEVGTRAAQGVPASLFEEMNEQLAFCQKAAQCTANREVTLNEIKTYICGESTRPLVLVGSSGCGKAALVARAAHLCPTWLPDAAVIIRFVGLTAHSSSSHLLLKSILDQCSVLHNGSVYRGRNDVATLTLELTRVMAALGRRRPAVLAIVGAGGLRGARWLPHVLPDNVKMLITVTEEQDDPSSSAVLAVLSDGAGGGPNMARAPPPAPAEARAVLSACAAQYARAAPAPPAALQAVHRLTLPLYAKILAWQISLPAETFSEHPDPESMMELKICPDLEGQLSQLLATTEAALGMARVRVCLAVLTASRRGLDDTEILDILAQDELFRSDKTYLSWAPAALFWPQLAHLLGAFLRWDGRGRARWRDAAVQRAAQDRYYPDHEVQARSTLVNYFEGVWFKENDPKMAGRLISQDNKFSDDCYNNRKLDELPYQHYHLTKSDPVSFSNRPYFTDHSWIYDKIAATDTGHLLEDIELIRLDPLPEHISILQEFLQIHSFALDYDVRQFYSLLRSYLEQRTKEGCELKTDICKGWLTAARNPPIPTLIATNVEAKIEHDLPRRDLSATDGFDSKIYDLVVRLEKCGRYVATLSTEREEICVWDATRCVKVRVLLGVTHPINLVPIDQYKCIVLCRRELRVYDLNKGTFLLTLKGVMNQKMPYYGLHDAQHLVCLSRNRMYVNLMHVGTGDCVTTFKAGEDRFLNSLLVSGDGRILVCGDETQKPFPLLVWSLTSRKLLYDLRIPHHDFVTSLAAITHEGSYVCVVARELDEPAPNFIVVYDLQSGTLFKKWKPGCDTAALAISSADGCVVSGLEDTRILVWDLVTGNCRFTLWGQTAAPGLLRLARAGAVLLSTDHKSRDLSVRLWDLNAGKLIAVYTPPERITSCEVLSGGSIIPLTLENHKMLITLKLEGPTPEAVLNAQEPYEECYGDADNEGKIFDLRDKEGNGNC